MLAISLSLGGHAELPRTKCWPTFEDRLKCGSRSPLLDLLDLLNIFEWWMIIYINIFYILLWPFLVIFWEHVWYWLMNFDDSISKLQWPTVFSREKRVFCWFHRSTVDPTPCEVVGSLVSTRSWDISWRNRRGPSAQAASRRRPPVPRVPASHLSVSRPRGQTLLEVAGGSLPWHMGKLGGMHLASDLQPGWRNVYTNFKPLHPVGVFSAAYSNRESCVFATDECTL